MQLEVNQKIEKMQTSNLDEILSSIKESKFTTEERSKIIGALLTSVNALPIADIVKVSSQGILLNGKSIDPAQIIALKQGADTLRNSTVRKIVSDQIKYLAVRIGVSEGMNPDQILFCKAAIWCLEQEEILLAKLTGDLIE